MVVQIDRAISERFRCHMLVKVSNSFNLQVISIHADMDFSSLQAPCQLYTTYLVYSRKIYVRQSLKDVTISANNQRCCNLAHAKFGSANTGAPTRLPVASNCPPALCCIAVGLTSDDAAHDCSPIDQKDFLMKRLPRRGCGLLPRKNNAIRWQRASHWPGSLSIVTQRTSPKYLTKIFDPSEYPTANNGALGKRL